MPDAFPEAGIQLRGNGMSLRGSVTSHKHPTDYTLLSIISLEELRLSYKP